MLILMKAFHQKHRRTVHTYRVSEPQPIVSSQLDLYGAIKNFEALTNFRINIFNQYK